jgi:hypothetical protein
VIELTNSSGRELASALMSTVPVALSGGGFFGDPAPKMPTGDTAKPERDTGKGTIARQPAQETDCKKYFPQTGQMISVPCEKKR